MVKPLLLVASVANIFCLASSTIKVYTISRGSASSGSSGSSSHSVATASAGVNQYPQNQHSPRKCRDPASPPSNGGPPPCYPPEYFCRANEIWSECPIAVCSPKTCDDVGFPVACPDFGPDGICPDKPACICREGFVKNQKGICIPMKHCPSCGGDDKAVIGCGTNCNRLCSNYNREPGACADVCYYNACDCRPGFVYDEIKRRCVFPSKCSRMTCTKKHEVYDPCPATCPFRTCGINDAAISCTPAPYPGDPNCPPPKCRCKDGYYRNDVGECVLWEQCPICSGLDEIYDPCPAPCPPQECDVNIALILCAVPPQLGDPECKPGCRCIDDYVRNHTGVCIPRDQCPTCPKQNEKYDPCIAPCPPRRCDVDDRLIKCAAPPKLGDPSCEAGCRCDDGYYRNSYGVCVTRAECPPTCGENEIYSDCIQGDCSPQNCTQLGYPIPCARIDPKFCKKGCLCKEGYVRNETGVCIPAKQCPSCGGDCNAESGCGNNCGRLCSNYKQEGVVCTLECQINGCDCKKGYVYDTNTKQCVLPEDCTPTCGANEIYSDCIQGNCSPQNCTQLGFPIPCARIDPKFCKKGCLCKEGYVRNGKGVCIPAKQCPSCGGDIHAEPGCGKNCGRLCSNYKQEGVVCTLECQINGCDCKKGYVYDTNTKQCVLPEDCTPVCKIDEVYSECVNKPCPVQNCSLIGVTVDCLKKPKHCIKGCLCKEPLMREDNGLCVPITECKSPVCKKNEVYSDCTNGGCNAKNCSQIGKPVPCVKLDPKSCIKGCLCKEGYLREDNGVCVPENECKKAVCKKNEVYSDCTNGGCNAKNCSQIGKPVPCVKLDPKSCIKGCLCKEGYLREDNGVCVPENECKKAVCKKNEVYSDCINGGCNAKNCSQIGKPVPCVKLDPKSCIKGCLCKEGYLREDNGVCVPENECKTSCGGDIHAEPGCGNNCGRLCSNYKQEGVVCTLECQINGCDCKKGYVYDTNTKQCVLPEDCTPVCKKNEVYSDCINGGCNAKNCSQIGKPVPCVKLDPKSCIKGCLCKEGYLREDNGVCVPENECKNKCNKPNEYYEPCDYDCPPRTCESLDRAYICPIGEGETCKSQCKCKEGFFRNKIGECITEEQCRRCMKRNEYYSCGGACDNVCATLKKQNQTNCPIVNIKCNEMCYCEKNYARAKNGTCIEIKKCNEPQCGENERYEKCPPWVCEPQTCSELGFPMKCPDVPADGKCPVKPSCVCIDGYVRNDTGVCIPKKDCPSCGGDCRAESGCGVNCGKKCEDLGKEPGPCIEICYINACDCKDGYYYDKNEKKCVLPSECSKICSGKYEVYENCLNPSCRPQKCTQLGFPLNCTDISTCKKGCICIEGYVRNSKGICIPVKQCPSCGGDKYAESGCGVNCLKKCYDLQNPDRPRPCPKICKVNSCDCKKNFYYDENTKKCVPSKKCTPSCGKDEEFDACINGGCEMRNCSQIGGPKLCIDPIECKAGCKCKKGYLRNKDGICIPIETCPEAKCCKNEKFVMCPDALCQPSRCDQLGYPIDCPVIEDDYCPGTPGCVCIDDYVKNEKGKCIPKRECPSCGGDHNAWSGCGVNCGKTCQDLIVKRRICPRICKVNACDCKDGFYHDGNLNKCVKANRCTPICTENQVFDSCVNGGCGHRNCSQINGPILCIDPIKCKGGCTCKENYLMLDETGECIPEKECPNLCEKPNEEFVKCPPTCPPQTCNSINETFHCPLIKTKIDPKNCVGECRCISGFYRNLANECISTEDCLKCPDKHQYYSCGPACDNICYELDLRSKDNCPIVNKKCNSQCYCEDGYAKDDNNICVLIEDCPGGNTPVNSTEVLANFERGNRKLSIDFMKNLLESRPGENFMFSALSVLIVLAQLALSAIGLSLDQLLRILNLKSKKETRVMFPFLLESLKDQQDAILKLANKVYANEGYPFTDQFDRNSKYFDSEIQNIDFSKNLEAAKQINEWVSSQTNGLIINLVNADMFNALTRVAFFNCLYFLGDWVHPFNPNNTRLRDFYLNDKDKVSLQTMYQENRFQYAEIDDLDAKVLQLLYKGNKFKLLICLPNEKTGLKSMLEKFDSDTITKILNSLTYQKVDLFFPRLNILTDISNLKGLLMKEVTLGEIGQIASIASVINSTENGLTALFEANDDFVGIFENKEKLLITDAVQKTNLKADETGTEAAAATGIVVGTTSVQLKYKFEWNHPAAFFLLSEKTLLLSGVFVGAQ